MTKCEEYEIDINDLAEALVENVKELLNSAPKVSRMLEDDAKYIGELDRALEVLNSQLSSAEGAEATQFKIDNVTRSIENAMEKMRAFNETVDSRRFERSGISALDDEMHKFDKSIRIVFIKSTRCNFYTHHSNKNYIKPFHHC